MLGWALWFGFFTWLIDEVVLLIVAGPASLRFLHGAAAAMFLALFAASLLGVAIGGVWAVSKGARPSSEVLGDARRRLTSLLWQGTQEEHVARAGAIFGWIALLALATGVSYFSTRSIVLSVARPENIAAFVLLVHVGLVLAAMVLRHFFVVLGRLYARLLAKIPGLRWLVGRTGRVAVELTVLAVIGAGIGAWLLRDPLSFLPWAEIGTVLGGLVLASLLVVLMRRFAFKRPGLRVARRAIGGVIVLGSAVAGALLPIHSGVALDAMSRRVVAGRAGHLLVSIALDFDGDGRTLGFGGGDCAPFDRRVYAGAVDVPDNGVDENCDGADLSMSEMADLRGRWDYDVPSAWPKRPDIVFISVDAFSTRSLRSYGAKRDVAPGIDRFASEGVLFESCFSQGPSTRLSFPAIFASRFDTKIDRELRGRWPFRIKPANTMLAEVLSEAGYRTIAISPHRYFTPRNWKGITQGFDEVVTDPSKAYSAARPHTAKEVTEAAIQRLAPTDDRPLFMWVHFYDAHYPHKQPSDVEAFGTARKDVYEAELRLVDRYFTKLVQAVRKEMPEALIVLTGDHAVGFDAPRHAKKGYGHDLSTVVLHVPLVFNAPFLTSRRISSIASTIDIAPTLANMLRLRKKLPFYGHSLVPSLSEGLGMRPPMIFSQYYVGESALRGDDPLRIVSVRTPRYNLVLERFSGRIQAWEWMEDYEERNDLWASELDELERQELEALKKSLDLFVYTTYDPEKHKPAKKSRPKRGKNKKRTTKKTARRPKK